MEANHLSNKEHDHTQDHGHSHSHAQIADPALLSTVQGLKAVKWSFFGMFLTALLQLAVVYYSGSVALLADTIHNFADALTAIPLWIAFKISHKPANKKYTYGYGRFEDFAGFIIVLIILISAVLAGYQAIQHLIDRQPVSHLGIVALASLLGFAGNEAVAIYRIRVGKEIGSAALVADGYHARVDGFTSLAVLVGVIGVKLGYSMADPIVALGISVIILRILWQSSKIVFSRLMDGADPQYLDEMRNVVSGIQGIEDVGEIRLRWLGHRLHGELNLAVDPLLNVKRAHELADEVRHELMHRLKYLSSVTIHVDPTTASGEKFHRIDDHKHDDFPPHSH